MSLNILIRPYQDEDRQAVRDLFVRVNRELAPASMRDRFEAYIALALRQEWRKGRKRRATPQPMHTKAGE